jgi:hypothetical protein
MTSCRGPCRALQVFFGFFWHFFRLEGDFYDGMALKGGGGFLDFFAGRVPPVLLVVGGGG